MNKSEKEQQTFRIARYIRYPCYDRKTKENDIMLLQVQSYISLVEYASPTLNYFLPSYEGDEPREFLVALFQG